MSARCFAASLALALTALWLAFVADVRAECGADAVCNKKIDDAREKSRLKAHLADRLLYRHWTDWKDGKRTHVLVLDLAKENGETRDLTPGDFDSPPFALGGPLGYAFSPDGKERAFTSNRSADEASSTNADLWTVPVEATPDALRSPRPVTAKNPAWNGSPAYSPEGRFLAYRTQKQPGSEADRFRIALHDRAARTSRILTESFDNTIGELAWSADSKTIRFTADVKGRTPLHELDVATGRIRALSAVGLLDAFVASRDGRFAVVSRRRVGSPQELWRIDLRAESPEADRRLTTHNAAVEAETNIRPAEEMTVAGRRQAGAVTAFKTPCLVITGQKDYRVPYTQSLMFFTDLQKRGVPSRLLVFDNAGHWPAWYEMALFYAAHLDRFRRYLGGSPPPWDPAKLVNGGGF